MPLNNNFKLANFEGFFGFSRITQNFDLLHVTRFQKSDLVPGREELVGRDEPEDCDEVGYDEVDYGEVGYGEVDYGVLEGYNDVGCDALEAVHDELVHDRSFGFQREQHFQKLHVRDEEGYGVLEGCNVEVVHDEKLLSADNRRI